MTKINSYYCSYCKENTLHIQNTPNHILHLLLTLCTAGLWVIVWIVVSIRMNKSYCEKCGKELNEDRHYNQAPPRKQMPETVCRCIAFQCKFCQNKMVLPVSKETITNADIAICSKCGRKILIVEHLA